MPPALLTNFKDGSHFLTPGGRTIKKTNKNQLKTGDNNVQQNNANSAFQKPNSIQTTAIPAIDSSA